MWGSAPMIVEGMYPDTLHARPETHNWRGLADTVNLIQRHQYF